MGYCTWNYNSRLNLCSSRGHLILINSRIFITSGRCSTRSSRPKLIRLTMLLIIVLLPLCRICARSRDTETLRIASSSRQCRIPPPVRIWSPCRTAISMTIDDQFVRCWGRWGYSGRVFCSRSCREGVRGLLGTGNDVGFIGAFFGWGSWGLRSGSRSISCLLARLRWWWRWIICLCRCWGWNYRLLIAFCREDMGIQNWQYDLPYKRGYLTS